MLIFVAGLCLLAIVIGGTQSVGLSLHCDDDAQNLLYERKFIKYNIEIKKVIIMKKVFVYTLIGGVIAILVNCENNKKEFPKGPSPEPYPPIHHCDYVRCNFCGSIHCSSNVYHKYQQVTASCTDCNGTGMQVDYRIICRHDVCHYDVCQTCLKEHCIKKTEHKHCIYCKGARQIKKCLPTRR